MFAILFIAMNLQLYSSDVKQAQDGTKFDEIAAMSLAQLKTNIYHVAKKAQEFLEDSEYEQEVVRINALNMHENKKSIDLVEQTTHVQCWINYLQIKPYLAFDKGDSFTISPVIKKCCRTLYNMQDDLKDLEQHIDWFIYQHKHCSILQNKADDLRYQIAYEQNNLANIIQQNVNHHVATIKQRLDHQMYIDQQAQSDYKFACNNFDRYKSTAHYLNNRRLKKAAIMIQAQARKMLSTTYAHEIRKDKICEQLVIDQVAQDLLKDVTDRMIYTESFIAHSRQEFIELKSAIMMQALTRGFIARSHYKNLQNQISQVTEQKIVEVVAQESLVVPAITETKLSERQAKRMRRQQKKLEEDALEEDVYLDKQIDENKAKPVYVSLSAEDKKIAELKKIIPTKKEDLNLKVIADVIALKEKYNLKKILKKAVCNTDKSHNSQVLREEIQSSKNQYAQDQVKMIEKSTAEFLWLTQLMNDYDAFAGAYDSPDLKAVKEKAVEFCAQALLYNREDVTGKIHLKARVDNFDAAYHHKIIIYLSGWGNIANGQSTQNSAIALHKKQKQIDDLQKRANDTLAIVKQTKEQKDKDAYKKLAEQILEEKKILAQLDRIHDACEILMMLHSLHQPDGPLDLNYMTDKTIAQYEKLLQQPISLPLQNMIQDMQVAGIKNQLALCQMENEKINLLSPFVTRCMQQLTISIDIKTDPFSDPIRHVSEDLQKIRAFDIDENDLPAWLHDNGLIWLNERILKNRSDGSICSYEQLAQMIQLNKYLIELLFDSFGN